MKFLSLEPFVPSGSNFQHSKQLFLELGFTISWTNGGLIGFERDGCKFILQEYENRAFAENFMISVRISNAKAFWEYVQEKNLAERFGVKITAPALQPYGWEVNLIDMAGVCWHFIE